MMERPVSTSISYGSRPPSSSSVSAAGTSAHHHTRSMSRTAANAIASLSGHGNGKATAASIGTSSTQSLFLQILRHLDLDQLYDSPSLTLHSLTSDARTRIRTAEWSLYQLFRLYDPAVATEKLQPFFPPLEPLQSVNLRAALFRCLNELKKDGLLGRETVLRKSLLDECLGDKFWELCVVFAGLVLRTVVSARIDEGQLAATTLALQVGTTQAMDSTDRESMLPLAIAHKKALVNVLEEKNRRKVRYQRLSSVLAETEEGLALRKVLAEQRARGSGQGKPGAQQTQIAEEVLQTQWMGSEELRDALLDGDEDAAKDSIFTRPFETVWEANVHDRLFSPSRADASVIEDLEFRTRHQRQRLRKWQTFHDKLAALKPLPGKDVNTTARETTLRFDRHHDLRVDEDVDSSAAPPERQERNTSASRYDEILTAMREELRRNHVLRKTSDAQQVAAPQTRRPSYRSYTSPSDASPGGLREVSSRSPSQTTVPIIRPGMSGRVSSRSYNQPKVVSQREPIPLKSELFSPLRSRQSSASPLPGTQVVTSPAMEDGEASSIAGDKTQSRSRDHSDGHGHADSGVGFNTSDNGNHSHGNSISYSESGSHSPKTVRWSTSSSSQADSGVDLPNRPILRSSNSSNGNGTAEHRPRPSSLAERTRMSMALSSTADYSTSSIDELSAVQPTPPGSDETPTPCNNHNTLTERTRQSMSLAPQPTPVPQKHRKSQSLHQQRHYPVNQFETPPRRYSRPAAFTPLEPSAFPEAPSPLDYGGVREPHAGGGADALQDGSHNDNDDDDDDDDDNDDGDGVGGGDGRRRVLTPRDKLFDDDAAYASVFKSRPKIALSPVLSPTRDLFGGESGGDRAEDDVSPEDGREMMSSPLMR